MLATVADGLVFIVSARFDFSFYAIVSDGQLVTVVTSLVQARSEAL